MLRPIAPTQFVTSGNFVSPTALATVDPLDFFIFADPEVYPIGPEIHRHGITRPDHADRAKQQRPFKGCCLLPDEARELRSTTGILALRGQGGLGCGATGKKDQCDIALHTAIFGCLAANTRRLAQSG